MRIPLAACMVLVGAVLGSTPRGAHADLPATAYIFPAGGQRGTAVDVRIGGMYLHDGCPLEIVGGGVSGPERIVPTETIWFEGPVLPLPDSQQAEDYPKDYAARFQIAGDAPAGARSWRVWTSQGAVPARSFVVGDLPEIVEQETDGLAAAVPVVLPVTINGRTFPREDLDEWSFALRAGESVTATVLARRIGSPVVPVVELLDPSGRAIAESFRGSAVDAVVRARATVDGVYRARIRDAKFGGLQGHVYRLTLTTGPWVDRVYPLGGRVGSSVRFELAGRAVPEAGWEVALPAGQPTRNWLLPFTPGAGVSNAIAIDLDDLPERMEADANETAAEAPAIELPSVLNGRIERPGDTDLYRFTAEPGTAWVFEVRAARLGSPLDAVLSILDAAGKELVQADDLDSGTTDCRLTFTPPTAGNYWLKVSERAPSRGGLEFAYRIRCTRDEPDFALQILPERPGAGADALTVERGGQAKLRLRAERRGGFAGPIALEFTGLPEGVTASPLEIPQGAQDFEVQLKAASESRIGTALVNVRGRGMQGEMSLIRPARAAGPVAEAEPLDGVRVAVALPTPFKIKGQYETKYAQRGGVFVRRFAIERSGFEGPLSVRLADRQGRHLQGVTGPTVVVPAGKSEFEYPVTLPPWMEVGRTSRSIVQLAGVVTLPDGSQHVVSATSNAQEDQIIILVDPGQLSVSARPKSVRIVPGTEERLSIEVGRGAGLSGPVRVELLPRDPVAGVAAEAIQVPAGEDRGQLRLVFAPGARLQGGRWMATLRATTTKSDNSPVVAETSLELVAP